MRWVLTKGMISFLRESFRNDGAEGESVHRVCGELERKHEQVEKLRTFIDRHFNYTAEERARALRGHPTSPLGRATALLKETEDV